MQIPSPHHVLVVAPDADFRESLRFALEAEGYDVTSRGDLSDPWPSPAGFDCSVLDNHAADRDMAQAQLFCATFRPVVLLANKTPHPVSEAAYWTILKPMLGAALALAVSQAIDTRAVPK